MPASSKRASAIAVTLPTLEDADPIHQRVFASSEAAADHHAFSSPIFTRIEGRKTGVRQGDSAIEGKEGLNMVTAASGRKEEKGQCVVMGERAGERRPAGWATTGMQQAVYELRRVENPLLHETSSA